MIRVILSGGLGNQMFEYASAFAWAKETGDDLLIDTSFFDVYGNRSWCRPYELASFALHENTDFTRRGRLAIHVLPKLSLYCRKRGTFHLGRYLFDADNWAEARKYHSTTLYGYFANCHLFERYRDELLKAFSFRYAPDAANTRLLNQIDSCQSVSVHIRRGDYLNSANAGVFHHPTVEWYRAAMRQISEQVENPVWFFFSDDMQWVKEQFADVQNSVFVDTNHGADAYNDMRLMSRCRHNIIANSSFSWWGAWLNTNPQKIVIAPDKYYNDDNANKKKYLSRMIPQDWKVLE